MAAVHEAEDPRLLSERELWQRMAIALEHSTPAIRQVGEQLAQMAFEARQAHEHYLGRGSREVRWFYRIGSWSYSGLSAVVAAAVGGAVLAFSEWPAWVRYSVAGVSLLTAFIGALRPSDYLARDLQRKELFQAFHRWTWQYILVGLPHANEQDARKRLNELGHSLDSIRGIEPSIFGRGA